MFGEFLNIIFKSIKLDKSLYTDNKNFGEASIYFAGIIMILDGIAGAVAANTVNQARVFGDSVWITDPLSAVSEFAQSKFVRTGEFWFKVFAPKAVGFPGVILDSFLVVIGLSESKAFLVTFPNRVRYVRKKSHRFSVSQCSGFGRSRFPSIIILN